MKTVQEIALALQGYDPGSMSVGEVELFLHQLAPGAVHLQTEVLPVAQALDRIVASDVISPLSVPPHDNSAMDGYAFSSHELSQAHDMQLTCVGTALAGPVWQGQVGPGECLKIIDRKSTRLNSSHVSESRMPSSA